MAACLSKVNYGRLEFDFLFFNLWLYYYLLLVYICIYEHALIELYSFQEPNS